MADLKSNDQTLPQRHVWRRLIAFAVDWLIVAMLFTAITSAVAAATGAKIIPASAIGYSSCDTFERYSVEELRRFLRVDENWEVSQVLCSETQNLIATHHVVQLIAQKTGQKADRRTISYYSDQNGSQVTALSAEPFMLLIFPLIMAALLVRYSTTPAKHIFGLKAVAQYKSAISWSMALRRELLKNFPFVVIGLVNAVTAIHSAGQHIDLEKAGELFAVMEQRLNHHFWLGIVATLAAALVLLWFYIGSFVRWNGQSYWDRFAGTFITKN